MVEMMLAEFVATGALLIFWFHGLFEGKRFWPNNCAIAGVAATIAAPATHPLIWRIIFNSSLFCINGRDATTNDVDDAGDYLSLAFIITGFLLCAALAKIGQKPPSIRVFKNCETKDF
jgi:hypothetical protein